MEKYKLFNDLNEMLTYSAQKFGDKNAFELEDRNITYSKLLRDIKVLSSVMKKKGYAGEKIALVGKNSYEWVLVYLSAIYSGSIVVPIDRALKDAEIENQIAVSGAKAVFVIEKKLETSCTAESDVRGLIENYKGYIEEFKTNPLNDSVYLFTSGTTSKPKIVPLTQKNIFSNIYSLSYHEKFTPNDRNLIILPLNHTFSITGVMLFLSIGLTLGFCDGLKIKKSLLKFKPTILVIVPLIAEALKKNILKEVNRQGKTDSFERAIKLGQKLPFVKKTLFKSINKGLGGSLKFIIVGGAPLMTETEKWFNDIGIYTVLGYGLTECSPVLCAENPKNMRYGSVGKPMRNIEISISPEGEILARGDNITRGYLNNPEKNSEVFVNGWFYTGDMGYIDKDGFLFITGRKKNMILTDNGKNVYPEEIETKLYRFEQVKECLVYQGTKDGKSIISCKIVYEPEQFSNMQFKEIESYFKKIVQRVNEELAEYQKIRMVEISDMPFEKTASMKIKRNIIN